MLCAIVKLREAGQGTCKVGRSQAGTGEAENAELPEDETLNCAKIVKGYSLGFDNIISSHSSHHYYILIRVNIFLSRSKLRLIISPGLFLISKLKYLKHHTFIGIFFL